MRWLLPVLVLSATGALAHDADLVVVRLEPGLLPGQLVETVTLTTATLAMLAPIDADGDQALTQGDLEARRKAVSVGFWDEVPVRAGGEACARSEEQATLKEGFIELRARWACGEGELRQDFKILRVLPANYRVTFDAQPLGDEAGPRFAQGSLTAITVPRAPPRSELAGAFERGLRRALAPEVLAAFFAVLLSIGAWRRGALAAALVVVALIPASFFGLDWWPTTLFLGVISVGVALKAPPMVVPVLLGGAIGLRDGAGGLGLGLGTAAVLLTLSPLALGLGAALQQRPRARMTLMWVAVTVVLGTAVRGWLSS